MSHRTADNDRERIHLARHPGYISDDHRRKTENVYQKMATGRYRSTIRAEREPDRTPDAAAVARLASELARGAVMPDALAVACTEHDAEPGVYCFRGARGVCGSRLDLRPRHA